MSRYLGDKRGCLLETISSIFWPNLAREGVRSNGRLYWMTCIEAFTSFVALNSQEPLMVAIPVTVFIGDLHLRVRRNYLGLIMTPEQASHQLTQREQTEEAKDHLLFSQLRAMSDSLEPVEFIAPFATVDPKGKAIETPSSNPKKKTLVQASEE